jgi:hypothetical protein
MTPAEPPLLLFGAGPSSPLQPPSLPPFGGLPLPELHRLLVECDEFSKKTAEDPTEGQFDTALERTQASILESRLSGRILDSLGSAAEVVGAASGRLSDCLGVVLPLCAANPSES